MPQMPPQPQVSPDADVRISELIPFRSAKISLWRSKALLPLILIGVTCVALFGFSIKTFSDVKSYMNAVAAFILLLAFLILYIYSGEQKNVLWYAFPAVVTIAQMIFLLGPYIFVFRKILPGNTDAKGFIPAFFGMFFGAGLMEELLKAVPVLFGLWLATRLRRSGSPGNTVTRGLSVHGPLDGLLMGAAAGAAFILIETMLMYVPSTVGKFPDQATGYLMGFTLMLPRVMKSVIGHMGYAGIFGYFIGLAATHPRAVWKLLPFGYLVAALLHAFWNSADELSESFGEYLAAALIGFTFFGCLLKARQLEASRTGGYIDGRSILALSTETMPAPVVPGGIVPPAPIGFAGALTTAATALEKVIGLVARTTKPGPATIQAPVVPTTGLSIGLGETRYALAADRAVDFSSLFGASGVTAGCAGTVAAEQDGTLALVNTGSSSWSVLYPDGSAAAILPGGRMRAGAGTRLVFGAATIDIQAF